MQASATPTMSLVDRSKWHVVLERSSEVGWIMTDWVKWLLFLLQLMDAEEEKEEKYRDEKTGRQRRHCCCSCFLWRKREKKIRINGRLINILILMLPHQH